jgi:hypothetical protein
VTDEKNDWQSSHCLNNENDSKISSSLPIGPHRMETFP